MIGVILTVSVLLAQAAPTATPASPSSVAAAAAPPSSTVSPVTVNGKKAAAKPDGSDMICRDEVVLGTLFPKRTCARRDEFAQRQREDQQTTREATNLRPWKDEGSSH